MWVVSIPNSSSPVVVTSKAQSPINIQLQMSVFSGGSRGGRPDPSGPPLFLDKTETRRGEKKLFWDLLPPYLRRDDRPFPPYLKVWKRHWCWLMLQTDTTIRTWPTSSHLNRTNLVPKGFTLWHIRDLFLPGPTREIPFAYSASQSELRINLILSAQSRIQPYNNRQMHPFATNGY